MTEKNKKKYKEIENELSESMSESDKDNFGRRTSYYVEENEKILNLLITNCEPILSEIVQQITHFNTYNQIQKSTDKAGIVREEISIS